MATLKDLEVKAADIQIACLTAPASERTWIGHGPEFGCDRSKVAIIARALQGIKSAGASFRNHLADHMREIGHASCKADADVWLKPETRPDNGFQCFHALWHVDNVLAMHDDAMTQTQQINKKFLLKAGSVGDADVCLGAKLRKAMLENGVEAWSMSASKHVQEAVMNVKNCLQEKEPSGPWLKKAPTPFVKDCRPKIDLSPEPGPEDASCCMLSQIGALRWMIELGRVDIITKVSMLASQLGCPRDGHLEAACHHIFAC
jgi:hypothetical protein